LTLIAALLTEILTKYEGLIHKKMPKDKFLTISKIGKEKVSEFNPSL
jgi:hypothetical protein